MQTELTQPSPLLDANGKLTQFGWSRKPLLDYNLENTRFHCLQIKCGQCIYGIKVEEKYQHSFTKRVFETKRTQ